MSIKEFILLGFGNLPQLQPFLFWLILVIYAMTITGNLLIFFLVVVDQQLHTPMYFFLANLSFLDTCYSSILLPKILANLLTGEGTITVSGCLTQYHLFSFCGSTETYLLAAMSYDSYLAICRPLLYVSIMNRKLCFQFMTVRWISSLIFNVILAAFMDQLSFCGPNFIDHYFCDFRPLEKLLCTDPSLFELFVFCMTVLFTIPPFLLALISYICIIVTIIKIKSTIGRQKGFFNLLLSSPCSLSLLWHINHCLCISRYPLLRHLNKILSVFYTVMTPLVNPLIYTLRNKDVHKALRRLGIKIIILSMLSETDNY